MKKTFRMSGFTLVEVLVSVMLTGIILTAAYSAFQGIIKSQVRLSGAMDIQRNLLYLNEKLARIIHNGGTLDYEEYFNRRMLGYSQGPTPVVAAGIYTFSNVSKYGNAGTLYFCGVSGNNDGCIGLNAVGAKPTPPAIKVVPTTTLYNRTAPIQQPYRQYRELAFNYGSNLPNPTKLPSIFPSNPADIPSNIPNIIKEGIPELYLIKKLPDGSYERVYFRHVFVLDPAIASSQPGATCDPTTPINCLGKLQMSKMVSCDKYTGSSWGIADGNIDRWIPHSDFSSLATPLNCSNTTSTNFDNPTSHLLWVDISTPDMNIVRAQFFPNPLKIPTLMAGTGEIDPESPTVRVHIEVQLSEIALRRGLLKNEGNPARTIITTFDLSDS